MKILHRNTLSPHGSEPHCCEEKRWPETPPFLLWASLFTSHLGEHWDTYRSRLKAAREEDLGTRTQVCAAIPSPFGTPVAAPHHLVQELSSPQPCLRLMQNRGVKGNWRIKDLLILYGRAQSPALMKGSTAGTARLSAGWVQIAKEIQAKYLPFGAIKQLHPKCWMKAKCFSSANLIMELTCLPLPTQQPGQQVCSLLPAVVSEVCFCSLFAHPFHGLTLSWGGGKRNHLHPWHLNWIFF